MKYLSVCSGIEAATVAWHPLGWTPVAFAEIEAFPSAVLAHHYPTVPNWGDITKFKEWPDATLDLLVGGTPCQSFSVAGLRKGLADPRGNLALTYLAIADRYRPEWLVWENVPGVLSADDGEAFGAFLGGLGELGYGWAYRVLDAQYFGVAQRRRRVFVVASARSWHRAAAVLFDSASLRGDSAPSREAREKAAPCLGAGPVGGGRTYGTDADSADSLIVNALTARVDRGGTNSEGQRLIAEAPPISLCLNAGAMGRIDAESETLIPIGGSFDASEDGSGRGTPIIPIQSVAAVREAKQNGIGIGQAGDPMFTMTARDQHAICFNAKDHGADAGPVAPTLRSGGHDKSHANGGTMPAIAFDARQSDVLQYGEKTGPLDTDGHSIGVHLAMQVRRLTPRECERLQGFGDDYTLIPYRGKPSADGPRYKALGNSMAVPCMAWIGRRIQQVSEIKQVEASA